MYLEFNWFVTDIQQQIEQSYFKNTLVWIVYTGSNSYFLLKKKSDLWSNFQLLCVEPDNKWN